MTARSVQRPEVDSLATVRILRELWGIDAAVRELPSERDRNYRAVAADGSEYVLKVAHADTTEANLAQQAAALRHVGEHAASVAVPRLVPAASGEESVRVSSASGSHLARVVTYLPGRTLGRINPKTAATLRAVGAAAGAVRAAMARFEVEGAPDDFSWDVRRAEATVAALAATMPAGPGKALLDRLVTRAAAALDEVRRDLEVHTIHGDMNDHNLIVGERIGVIDFGDVHRSWSVAEVAIPAAYAAFGFVDPIEPMAAVAAGAHRVAALSEADMTALVPIAVLRLAISVAMAEHQTGADPDNEYLAISRKDAWSTLSRIDAIPPYLAEARIRDACGLAPCRRSTSVAAWLAGARDRLHPVVGVALDAEAAAVIDWSVTSPEADHPAAAAPMERQIRRVEEAMTLASASVGVGRYGEPRLVYAAPEFAVETNRGPGWRTVHLGVDLSCPAGTAVNALYDGWVERVDDEALDGGYGPVITLRHEPEGSPAFYTLYGHLDGTSITLTQGAAVTGGERIATVGAPPGNGNWTPHLHFQVITDLLGIDGPFPGVALPDHWGVWGSLCPSPRDALGLPAAMVDAPRPDDEAVAGAQRRMLPPSQTISYRRPLVAVRGFGAYLYDGWGRAHVDGVNNVAHVGHEHPRVVAALRRQATILNTNARYPHPERVRYLARLAARFPHPLDTVFLVCSGSEANDLALRIARTVTGRTAVAVLESAYHGHTTDLIAASPYKHDGPGGTGTPPGTVKLPLPDPYRSPLGGDTGAHLAVVEDAFAENAPAAFIAESIPGVAGQIVLPDGYLRGAFAAVRKTGGIAIADEVQVGLGRVGSHWWGFERDGAMPDIVTLGKPLGNGHPMAAVVTTRAIAEAFATGMEYFNTFGGNPVSCAVGNAVLDVIEDEGLREHATATGRLLQDALGELATRFELIGDVRGAGMFLGVELVTDRAAKAPAPIQAAYVAERARELGVLLSVDGRHRNVLKLKPPLVFGDREASRVLAVLEEVLAEDGARSF